MNSIVPAVPTILVVFGATGDLMGKKIIPSVFHLWKKGKLPERFRVLGVSRQEFSHEAFQKRVGDLLVKHGDSPEPGELETFVGFFRYSQGYFDQAEAYEKLSRTLAETDAEWGMCSNKLFYLAVPPSFYDPIARHLSASGLTKPCGGDEGWTRVIVEKPFGQDCATAEKLDELLGELFKEEQIYRIDHYLAKEMLQNILAFRFSNNLFEKSWDKDLVESVDIRLLESIGAEDRGAFYDSVGALRDVGQNHLLQMLALITMEHPLGYGADAVRKKRSEVLRTIRIPTREEARRLSFRAQYEGYRTITGVAPDSNTETYFKVRGFMEHPRWTGVPFTFEGGKRLGSPIKEAVVTFKHPSPCLCPPTEIEHFKNKVIFRLEPNEGITIQFWSKKPGLDMVMEERDFNFTYREQGKRSQYTEEYEKLLLDCIMGDQTLFVSTAEISAMWRFIDPIISVWQSNEVPLEMYRPDTKDITMKAGVSFHSESLPVQERKIGIVGLGKMGKGLALRLAEHGWEVGAYDANLESARSIEGKGIVPKETLEALLDQVPGSRLIWLMVPAGKIVDETLEKILPHLSPGDTIIDGGNSFFKDSVRRGKVCAERGVHFLDVGVSGGPAGARNGACLMIGGDKKVFDGLKDLFEDLALPGGYGYMGLTGAGHFVKMVHNGIEYGMMQAIAEGFAVMRASDLSLALTEITRLYNRGSVIESRLVGWLKSGYEAYGEELESITGSVAQSGEGLWTVETAKEFGIPVPVIEDALKFRFDSQKNPSYTGKVLSALRNQFGGHSAK